MTHYDAIVIGSGQAGNPLVQALAGDGWKVALIEREHLGGTCINYGCTPTKTMVMSAQVAHYARSAARWGVRASEVSVDLPAIIARKESVVRSFREGQERKDAALSSLRVYRGHGRFMAPHQVQVGDELLESERIFINTGTRPAVPPIPGLEEAGYLTNRTAMELRELPEHLIVLGGGYIGLEFGQMFRRFGSKVTVIHRGARLMDREDAEVSEELRRLLEAEGVTFNTGATTTRVERTGGQVVVHLIGEGLPESVSGSHLLVATGRRPNTDDLGLEEAGVETDDHGFVRVNGRLETNVPGIWALGDVKGGPAFTHISYNDFQIVYANIKGESRTIEGRPVPYTVFTDPQLGRVGMTEREARKTGKPLKIAKIPMSYVARAIERDETGGLMKLIVDGETDRILGAAILATEGGELIQILSAFMLTGARYTLLKGAVYIHPTLAEGFFALMDSVA